MKLPFGLKASEVTRLRVELMHAMASAGFFGVPNPKLRRQIVAAGRKAGDAEVIAHAIDRPFCHLQRLLKFLAILDSPLADFAVGLPRS